MHRAWILIIVVGLLSCNGKNVDGEEPLTERTNKVISQMAKKGDLFAKALVASGLNASLTEESYPFVLG